MDRVRQNFVRFAEVECGASPLYRALATAVAGDDFLTGLAAACPLGQPRPNLLFAAVQYLLLKGVRHPLGRYYPSVTPAAVPPDSDLGAALHDFAAANEAAIRPLLAARLVQTNEVARAAVLLPAFGRAAAEAGAPLALLELGTSAGLLLHTDRYAYTYSSGQTWGNPDAALNLECKVRGSKVPPLPDRLEIAERCGIDLNPVDPGEPDEALWLRALVWADQTERAARLQQAVAAAAAHPVRLLKGDALALLPAVIATLPPGLAPVVFHSHVLNQWPRDLRERLSAVLAELSAGRPLWRIALEYAPGAPAPDVTVERWEEGRLAHSEILAHYQPHGHWLEWLA